MYQKYFKRILDLLLALVSLVIFIPIAILICLISLLTFKGRVFFKQKRIGRGHKTIFIYKFRSMNDLKDSYGNLLPESERVNAWGLFLRRYSLDEIPQIISILKGDLSFVGPRPLLVEYLPYYSAEENNRHNVKPGLTGLAQVNGRNNIPWPTRFSYDIYYTNNLSFVLDIKILARTIFQIFSGQNTKFSSSLAQERASMEIKAGVTN